MPTTFRRKGTLPEINSWNALYNRASGNALWSDATFAGLDNPVFQANYIAMLAGNTKSLQDRLPEDFNYASAATQYSVLATLNSFTQEELKMSDEQYAESQQNKLNQAFNEQITSDESFQQYGGINEFVQNNYSGDYSKFYQDYGDNYEGFMSPENLESISPENYEGVTPESTKEAFDYLSNEYKQLETRYSKERDITWAKLLDKIELEKSEYLRKKAYDEASFWEKAGQTFATYLAAPFTEAGEIIEGIIDGGATIAMWITNTFGNENTANDIRDFIGRDIIPLDTMVKEALPASWATSDYSAWYNPFKFSYNIGTSIADMAPMALNMVVPGLGTGIYYASSAGRTAEATIQEHPDWSINEITLYTAGATAIEYLTEKINTDVIFGPGWFSKYTSLGGTKVGQALNKVSQKPILRNIKEALGEGLEEVISEFGSSLLEGVMTGDFDSAFEDFGTNALQAFVIGSAVGGVMSVSSSAKVRRLVNKVHKQVTTSNGNTITLTMAQSVMVDNFITEMEDRLAKGEALSEKNRARYDALKSLQVRDMDIAAVKSMLNAARRKSYLNMRGRVTYTVNSQKTPQLPATEQIVSESNVSTPATEIKTYRALYGYHGVVSRARETESGYTYTYRTLTDTYENYDTLTSIYASADLTYQYDTTNIQQNYDGYAYTYQDVPEDIASKLSTEVSLLLELQTNSLIKQFGQEAVTNGLRIFSQYEIKTVDDIIEIAKYKPVAASEAEGLKASLIEYFGGDLDIVLTERSKNDPHAADGMDIRDIIGAIDNKNRIAVQTFVTTKSNLPTIFMYEYNGKPILMINHSLLQARSLGTLIRMSVAIKSTYQLYNKLLQAASTSLDVIDSFIKQAGIENIPIDLARQQLLFMAAFVEDNPIANAMAWHDFEGFSKIKEVFAADLDSIIAEVKYVAGSALKAYDSVILSNISEEQIDDYKPNLSQQLTDDQIKSKFEAELSITRTSPYLYFGEPANMQAVKLITAIKILGKEYGFNYPNIMSLPLEQAIPKIFDTNNYTKEGLKKLKRELSRYTSENSLLTTFRMQLNYYLQDAFGFSVTADNVIITNEFVVDIINIDKLSELLSDGDIEFKLSDILTERGRNRLGKNFIDVTITYNRPASAFARKNSPRGAFIPNFTTSGSTSMGEISLRRYNKNKKVNTVGLLDSNFNRISISDTCADCIHEVQHGIAYLTGMAHSPAAPLFTYVGKIIDKITENKSDSKKLYDFCIKFEIIKTSEYPDVKSFISDIIKNYQLKARLSKEIYFKIYWYFDINEAFARGNISLATSQTQLTAYGIGYGRNGNMYILQTYSKDPFIKLFDGLIIDDNYIPVKERWFSELQDSQVTNDDAIKEIFSSTPGVAAPEYSLESSKPVTVEDLAKVFSEENMPKNISLVATKNYWIDKATDPDLRNYIANLSELQFKRYLKQFTGVSLDAISKDFKPNFDVAEIELAKDTNYTGAIVKDADNNIRLVSTANPNATFSEYDAQGLVLWNAKTNTAIFDINSTHLGRDTSIAMRKINSWTKNQRFIVGSRVFNSGNSAAKYLDTQPYAASNENSNLAANFDALFTKITKTAIKGPVAIYNLDTIFITNDGQIYNIDSNGNLLQTLKGMCDVDYQETIGDIRVNPITGEAIPGEEGLNSTLIQLFNSKRVIRLYKQGDTWEAYGRPNILQDNFIKLMRANANNHSYLLEGDIGYNIRKSALIIENGKVKIKYADNSGNINGQEVPWRTSKWYSAICNIISKYQLTSISQFKRLGFSEDFINHIATYTGRRMSKKTREFYDVNRAEEVYNGIDHSYVIQYINDDTNTELSRNILIANCPDSTAESGNLDWKQNAHIHTVKEAKDYLAAVGSYWAAMARSGDMNVYATILDLQEAYRNKINSQDSKFIALSNIMADLTKNGGKITAVLNDDARKAGNIVTPKDKEGNVTGESYQNKIYHNGLDLSLIAFSNVKYRMEQGEYSLDVQTTQDEQTTVNKDNDGTVYLSDKFAAETNYGNVEDIVINRETQAEIEEITDRINKANKADNLQWRLSAFQDILESLPSYGLDPGTEKTIRQRLQSAIENLSNRTITRLDEVGIQNEIDRLTKKFQEDAKLTGDAAVRARAENDYAYNKFTIDKVRNVARYGEEGYRKILSVYSQNNATQLNNISSKFSRFFKQLKNAGNTQSATQQYYQRLMATQVKGGDKLGLANEMYDLIKLTLQTHNNKKLQEFYVNKLQPYIYDAIQTGQYKFSGPIDSVILDTVDSIVNNTEISNSNKAATLMNILEEYTGNENPSENLSKEAEIRLRKIIDDLVPSGPVINFSRKDRIDVDKLKSILQKTLSEGEVNTTVQTTRTIDRISQKKDTSLDTTVAEKWNTIKQANFEVNYISSTYNRLIQEYRKLANSKPVTNEDMSQALKDVYTLISNTNLSGKEHMQFFDITRSNYREIARSDWENANPNMAEFLTDSDLREELANKEFAKRFPEKAKIRANSEDYLNTPERHAMLLEAQNDYTSFTKSYIQNKIKEYREHRSAYVNSRIELLRRQYREESSARTLAASDYWRTTNPTGYDELRKFEASNRELFTTYARYSQRIQTLENQITKANSDGNAKLSERLTSELNNYRNLLNELTPAYNRINSLLSERTRAINQYYSDNPLSIPEEYRIDQRTLKDYLKENANSSTLIKRINGLRIVYTEFLLSPKTEASIAQFKANVESVLVDGRLNDYIRGDTKRQLLQISDTLPRSDTGRKPVAIFNEILNTFAAGVYTDKSNIIDEVITTQNRQYEDLLRNEATRIVELNTGETQQQMEGMVNSQSRLVELGAYKKAYESEYNISNTAKNANDAGRVAETEIRESIENANSIYSAADIYDELLQIKGLYDTWRDTYDNRYNTELQTNGHDSIKARASAIKDANNAAEKRAKRLTKLHIFTDIRNSFISETDESMDTNFDDNMTSIDPSMFNPSLESDMSMDEYFSGLVSAVDEIDEFAEQTGKKPKRSEEEMFQPLDTEDVKMHKTIQSPYLYDYGVDIRPVFEYVFEKKEERTLLGKPFDRQIFNVEEFRKNPKIAEIIKNLQDNEEAAAKFVEWAANRPSINSEYHSRMLILLNIIRTAPNLSVETRTAAREIFEVERSASARNLGMFKNTGLIPTEELCEIALANFSLTPEEKLELQEIINRQAKAIENNDYATADKATEDMLKIFEKHKNELDNSINFFTAKTPEEKAVRLRNLANRLTAYRYFAMLSLPATFFTRNVTSNAILTAMDKTAAGISTVAMKGVEKIAGTKGQYKRTKNKVSDEAKQVVEAKLVKNGLLDSILNNTVSKYDTGYDYTQTALEKIGMDDLMDDPTDARVQALNSRLNEKTPFGDGNFGRFLNTIYNKIFGIMDKYDKIVMRKRIIEMVNKLVSDNFTSEQLQQLNNNDKIMQQRFDDIVEYARLEATKIYLRSMPKLYKTIMSALDKYPVAKVITSIIIPFPRMVINTTMTALAYSPFGLIKAGLTLARDQSAFRNITAAKQLGRAVVGTTGIILGAILASLGLLAIDDDDEYAGPQLVLFGKFSMSLENLSPASLPFIVGASMASDSTAGVWDTLLIGGNALFDATFIGELINSFGGNKEPVDIISNTFASFVTQFIPSFIRRAAQVIDPYQKDTSGNWKFVKRIIQAIPGASLLLDNKVDPYTGEDMTRYTNNNNPWLSRFLAIFNAIYPMQTKYMGESKVETESETVDAATTGPSSTYTIDGVTYKLSSKQYKDYQKLRAQLYSQYANELINTDRYKKMSMENKRKALKSLQNRATTEARRQLKIGQYAR